jgi:branched-chain amino acid transport system substrate-binding protein
MPGRRRVLLALVALVAVLAPAGCTPTRNPDPIVVAHLAPLSGPDKAAGEHARQGIDLAVDEVNQEGNRINNRPVHVLHPDTAGDADAVQAQTVRAVTVNHAVALLGGTDPVAFERLGRAAQPYPVPVLAPAALAGPPAGDFLFSTGVAPGYQGQVLARFTREVLKPANVLVVSDVRSNGAGLLAAAFLREVGQGEAVKTTEATYRADTDFAGLVERVKKARPKALLLAGTAGDVVKLRPQLHDAAPEAALVVGTSEDGPAALAEDRAAAGTVYLASAFATDALTPKGQEVARKYRERFGQDLDGYGALAYDDARILFEAFRRARTTRGDEVRKVLLNLDNFEGLTGVVAFTKEHTARRPLFVLRLAEGKVQLAKRYDPDSK